MNLKKILLATTAATLVSGAAMAADDGLVVLDWSGYEDEGFFQKYIAQHGDAPTYSFFGEEEEAFQKLRAGFRADVSHPCSQSVSKWLEAGLLEPLDTSRIDLWDDVNAEMKEAFKFDGAYYLLPMDWGTTALTYRTDMVDMAKMDSLAVFLDPAYAGRIALPDNVDDIYALGYLANGVTDWTKATDADFEAASAWLRQAHQNVRAYWADGAELAQLMGSGEVVVSWAWSETPATMAAEGLPVDANRSTKEGSSSWFCGYVNFKDAPGSEDQAYDFINAWLDHGAAQPLLDNVGYASTNAVSMQSIDLAALKAADVDPITSTMLAQTPIDPALRDRMVKEFEDIKAGF